MAQTSNEAYKSLSSLASLVRRTVPELNALMEGPLVKPYFDHFYKEWLEPRRQRIAGARARPIGITRPSLQAVQQYISVGERDGKQTYTSAYPNRVNWTETDYYAELLERIYQQNCANRNGLFFGSATVDRDAAYSIVWQIIRRLVDNSRTSRHVPFSAAPGDMPAVKIRPLVVFWKNVNDRQHGWYHESNRLEEAIFYAKDPTEYATLNIFKSAISANFQLHIPELAIAKLYQVRYTNDGVVTALLTAPLWTQIQMAKRGSDHRITLFLETQSQETGGNIDEENDSRLEDNLDPHNPASVSELFLTNMELCGNMDEAYISMI
ncbi:MAG: hypothetical protein M1839_008487 [Geoglossum umbratile]|nr:MAG: hypothetical protein M1839_008487 [Geoglossum umbratile]